MKVAGRTARRRRITTPGAGPNLRRPICRWRRERYSCTSLLQTGRWCSAAS